MLKPNVRQMLEVAKGCGLVTLEEAYSNYMSHYDMFFLIDDYSNQYDEFCVCIRELGWVGTDNLLIEKSIEECLEQLDAQ